MAVTFTPTYSSRLNAAGGSPLLVRGTITTTANDAVTPASLGYAAVLAFIGPVVDSGDKTYLPFVQSLTPTSGLLLCPIDNSDASFPMRDETWPSETYTVTFLAL
jgi:hypothetical protein